MATKDTSTVLTLMMAAGLFGQAPAPSSGIDISGSWYDVIFQETSRTASGSLVEYPGIPVNDPGRIYALTWTLRG